jgi:delta-aminolevulinic acid dehydratase/porphobilinogen synthase
MKNTLKLTIWFIILFIVITLLFGCNNNTITEPTGKKDNKEAVNKFKIEITKTDNTVIVYDIVMCEYDNNTKDNLLILTFEECGEVYPNFIETIKYFKIY